MARFRSKPIEIEATQWNKPGDHPAVSNLQPHMVRGHQGLSRVNAGDWIIAEPDGNGFYPCSSVTFDTRWEPIDG